MGSTIASLIANIFVGCLERDDNGVVMHAMHERGHESQIAWMIQAKRTCSEPA